MCVRLAVATLMAMLATAAIAVADDHQLGPGNVVNNPYFTTDTDAWAGSGQREWVASPPAGTTGGAMRVINDAAPVGQFTGVIAFQCAQYVPHVGRLLLRASAYIPAGQDGFAFARLDATGYFNESCDGDNLSGVSQVAFGLPALGAWETVTVLFRIPPAAGSIEVALLVAKTGPGTAAVLFDDVYLGPAYALMMPMLATGN